LETPGEAVKVNKPEEMDTISEEKSKEREAPYQLGYS